MPYDYSMQDQVNPRHLVATIKYLFEVYLKSEDCKNENPQTRADIFFDMSVLADSINQNDAVRPKTKDSFAEVAKTAFVCLSVIDIMLTCTLNSFAFC